MTNSKGVPIGLAILRPCLPDVSVETRSKLYRGLILVLTFLTYASYHLSRKAISVVKNTWDPKANCSSRWHWNNTGNVSESMMYSDDFEETTEYYDNGNGSTVSPTTPAHLTWPKCGWEPFIGSEIELALLDFTYLGSYAFFMFFMGQIGDRTNLRYFLFVGMASSGLLTAALGFPLWLNIHSFAYFFIVQFVAGAAQSTGWPATVAVVGHWFGKGNRGVILGIWNSHTSVGNILGSAIAGIWTGPSEWGYAFLVPGCIIFGVGVLVLLFMVVDPGSVDCIPPDHNPDSIGNTETTPLLADSKKLKQPVLGQGDTSTDSDTEAGTVKEKKALTILDALKIPGVIEFSLSLFFAKFVPYIFLYWLPVYIRDHKIGGKTISSEKAADLSTLFDVGGVIGGIAAGLISDRGGGTRGLTCVGMLIISIPLLWIFNHFGSTNMHTFIALTMISGFFVNGPYALITTAVSSDLGNHEVLKGNQQAKATVAAIIDGTGSIGAALGPLITGIGLQKTKNWILIIMICMGSTLIAALLLTRICIREIKRLLGRRSEADTVVIQ